MQTSPPEPAAAKRSGGTAGAGETLEIDISRMDPEEREDFLLFMDGVDIEHEVRGYLLVISAADEARTRQILAAVSEDAMVDFDMDGNQVDDSDEDSEWSRTIAAMLHPSGRCEATAPVGIARRVVATLVSYTIWWLLVVVLFAVLTIMPIAPTYLLVVALSLVPFAAEIWTTARFGRSPGKFLLNMRVSTPAGRVPSWPAATVRTLVLTWPFLLTYFVGPLAELALVATAVWIGVVAVSISVDPRRRGLHDRAAGTEVLDGRGFVGPLGERRS